MLYFTYTDKEIETIRLNWSDPPESIHFGGNFLVQLSDSMDSRGATLIQHLEQGVYTVSLHHQIKTDRLIVVGVQHSVLTIVDLPMSYLTTFCGGVSKLRSALKFRAALEREGSLWLGDQTIAGRSFPWGLPFQFDGQVIKSDLTDAESNLVLVWDPESVSEQEYADIYSAIGDLVRAAGGEGLEILKEQGFGVSHEVAR